MSRSETVAMDRPSGLLRPLLGLAALAAVVRAVSWSATVIMMNDGPDFLWQARQVLAGRFDLALAHPYHPLYGTVVAGVAKLTGADLADAAVAASITAGCVVVVAVGCATARIVDGAAARRTALAASLAFALHPRAVNYSAEVSSDALYLGCTALAIATFLAGVAQGSRARAVATGVLAGLAYLARPEGLFVGAVVALWIVVTLVRERAVARALSTGALVAAGTLVCVAPYVLAIHDATGTWALSMKPSVGSVGLTEITSDSGEVPATSPHGWPEVVPAGRAARERTDDEVPRTRVVVPLAGERDHPLVTTLDVLGGTLRAEGSLLFLIGLVALARRRETRPALAAVGALLVAWCALMVVHVASRGYLSNRHMMTGLLLASPAIGAGLTALWDGRRAARVLGVLLVVSMAWYAIAPRRGDEVHLAAAARHVATLAPDDAAVAVPRRRWGHVTGRRGLVARFPVHEGDMLRKLEREGVTHLISTREDVDPAWLTDERFETVAVFGGDDDDPLHRPTPRPWWWRWGLGAPEPDDAAVVLRWRGGR